jgi:enoyl-[acyl-carrier protein] reductase II
VQAREDSTMRTRCYTGKPCRVIRNAYAAEWEKDPSKIKPFPQQGMISRQNGVMNYAGIGGAHADPDRTFMPTGQGAGLIGEIKPAAEVFADLIREAEATIRRSQVLLAESSRESFSAAHPR